MPATPWLEVMTRLTQFPIYRRHDQVAHKSVARSSVAFACQKRISDIAMRVSDHAGPRCSGWLAGCLVGSQCAWRVASETYAKLLTQKATKRNANTEPGEEQEEENEEANPKKKLRRWRQRQRERQTLTLTLRWVYETWQSLDYRNLIRSVCVCVSAGIRFFGAVCAFCWVLGHGSCLKSFVLRWLKQYISISC